MINWIFFLYFYLVRQLIFSLDVETENNKKKSNLYKQILQHVPVANRSMAHRKMVIANNFYYVGTFFFSSCNNK